MLKKLIVDLGERSYPIFIADGALASPELWQDCLVKRGKVVIVTNETVQKWYLDPLKNALKSIGVDALSCILPDGEQYKDLEHFNDILTFLKVRASYGLVGNDQIGGKRYLYLPGTYSINMGPGSFTSTTRPISIPSI